MIFKETKLAGAFVIEPERIEDERGTFARTYCREEFARHGIDAVWVQCNISFNRRKGTLRGMHYQAPPYGEPKLIRCTMGAIYDVIVDLRPGSATRGQWEAEELTADNRRMIYVPEGFAHGFQTLTDDAEVFYQMGAEYAPEAARGVRWNDPALGIEWPIDPPSAVSPKDRAFPSLGEG